MRRKQRTFLGCCFFCSLVGGVLVALLIWTDRQRQLDRLLISALKRGDAPAAHTALMQGADANTRDERELSAWARLIKLVRRVPSTAELGTDTPLIVLLRDHGAEDETQKIGLRPPAEDESLVKDLLVHGATVDLPGDGGCTPLSIALVNSKAASARILLEHGANPNAGLPDCNWLISAVGSKFNAPVVELMLQHGADVNRPDFMGVTPLSTAINRGDTKAVAILLRYHADPNQRARGIGGDRPIVYAEKHKMTEIARLLKDAGAQR